MKERDRGKMKKKIEVTKKKKKKKKKKKTEEITSIFCYLFLDFHVKTGTRISLRYKRLFEISEIEITRVDCI